MLRRGGVSSALRHIQEPLASRLQYSNYGSRPAGRSSGIAPWPPWWWRGTGPGCPVAHAPPAAEQIGRRAPSPAPSPAAGWLTAARRQFGGLTKMLTKYLVNVPT